MVMLISFTKKVALVRYKAIIDDESSHGQQGPHCLHKADHKPRTGKRGFLHITTILFSWSFSNFITVPSYTLFLQCVLSIVNFSTSIFTSILPRILHFLKVSKCASLSISSWALKLPTFLEQLFRQPNIIHSNKVARPLALHAVVGQYWPLVLQRRALLRISMFRILSSHLIFMMLRRHHNLLEGLQQYAICRL